jgi:hypothetical protein
LIGAFFLALGLLLLGGQGFLDRGGDQASHSASAIDRLSIDMETAGNGAAVGTAMATAWWTPEGAAGGGPAATGSMTTMMEAQPPPRINARR